MIICQQQKQQSTLIHLRGGHEDEHEARRRDSSPLTAAGLAASQSADIAATVFTPPPSYDRSVYENPSAMAAYKEQVFQQGTRVTSAATGKTLLPTQAEAQAVHGENWTQYAMDTDHIIPVKQVHEQLKDNPFLTNDDCREIANIRENFQPLGRADNASKGGQNNEDFINNPNRQVKITRKGAENLRQSQQEAQSVITAAKVKRTIYRVGETFHNAGTQAAQYGGTASLTTSGITNIVALIKGEKSPKDALAYTVKDGAKGAVTSYVVGGGLSTLENPRGKPQML